MRGRAAVKGGAAIAERNAMMLSQAEAPRGPVLAVWRGRAKDHGALDGRAAG